jgi:formylglycine-generating enzyme
MWSMISALLLLALAQDTTRPGRIFRDRPDLPQMVVIPAGEGLIGSTPAETSREGRAPEQAAAEHPQRTIRIERPFAVGRFHVTQAEFAAFARATKRDMAGCVVLLAGKWSEGADRRYSFGNPGWKQARSEPAVCVSWDDAAAYTDWLSRRTGARYRLLSEEEWEYAARAGTVTARWWGDGREVLCRNANGGDRAYARVMPGDTTANLGCSDDFPYTSRSGRFPANGFGLHDMLGNAWQWTRDCFTARADGTCAARSIRGGSWHNGPAVLRSATRFALPPGLRSSSLGFRVMRELP